MVDWVDFWLTRPQLRAETPEADAAAARAAAAKANNRRAELEEVRTCFRSDCSHNNRRAEVSGAGVRVLGF